MGGSNCRAAPAELAEVWVVGRDIMGRVLLRDQIRAESKEVLAELKRRWASARSC
jgi:Cd2+/Zn2+-exporting ATPase